MAGDEGLERNAGLWERLRSIPRMAPSMIVLRIVMSLLYHYLLAAEGA
jgi:hypothetical protein